MLLVFHLSAFAFRHDCSVDQVLEVGEGVVHQLVLQWVDQPFQEVGLLLLVSEDFLGCVAGKLNEAVAVLPHRS